MLPDHHLSTRDTLCIGFRGGKAEQLAAIGLCRCYHGQVLIREGDVMLIEVGGPRDAITDLLTKLPRSGVTHLWWSSAAIAAGDSKETNFCRA